MTFYELEKKCKQRRLKKYLYIVLIIIILIAIGTAIFFYNIKTKNKNHFIKTTTHKVIKKKLDLVEKNTSSKSILLINTNNKPAPKIKKTVEINKTIKAIKENNKTNIIISKKAKQTTSDSVVLTPIVPEIVVSNNINNKKVKLVKTNPTKIITPSKINKNNNSVIQVESLPSYKKCINIAKRYLKKRDYKLALKWAKNANIQNKELPDSWIVTAKALFYSGKKEKAIEILKVYLKYKNNKEMKKLLRKFENEKNNN